mgnify:CR=1 FL=1
MLQMLALAVLLLLLLLLLLVVHPSPLLLTSFVSNDAAALLRGKKRAKENGERRLGEGAREYQQTKGHHKLARLKTPRST